MQPRTAKGVHGGKHSSLVRERGGLFSRRDHRPQESPRTSTTPDPETPSGRERSALLDALPAVLSILAVAACSLSPSRSTLASIAGADETQSERDAADRAHIALLTEERFPSATKCRACHEQHYREWSVSSHAYAQISPVFNAMSGTLIKGTSGTLGDFCIRCHTPVGMAMGEPVFASNSERSHVSLEGVTCVVCHRVNKEFGKISGRFPIVQGDLFQPVYGPHDNEELRRVLDSPEEYRGLKSEAGKPGRSIHSDARPLFQITTPGFCGRCHDVRFVDGFRLEDAFSEYKQSPAAKRGETCQDCHMGVTPGIASGYATAPAAVIGGVPTTPRKHTNHMLTGPDYSVVHPGIFPQDPEAKEFAKPMEWTSFDYLAGWGTDEFEDEVAEDYEFPERWAWPDDRFDAREIIDRQLQLLEEGRERSTELLRNGYQIGEVVTTRGDLGGISFKVEVRNATDGHNVPTGFSAERMVFLQVTVTDPEGRVIFRSGDLDPNGDVRDLHSLYVRDGKLPRDASLFNLQSLFLTLNVRGSEREQVLAVNYSVDPLPFARPATASSILTGGTPYARIHKRSIEPDGNRWARYQVDADDLSGVGDYRVSIKLVAGMVPVNLVDAIKAVGFDYGLSPRDIGDAIVAGHRVLWEQEMTVEVRE